MALDASKVRVAVTGVLSSGPTASTAPTGTGSVLTGFTDLGYLSDAGVTQTLPGGGDSTPIKAWQNGATVRTIRSPSEDNPTYNFVLLETKLAVIELYSGATVTAAVADGSWVIDNTVARAYQSFVLDVVDGAELVRIYIPRGIVTEVGDQVFAHEEPIGWELTVEAERDSVKAYNVKTWATAVKT